MAAALNQCKLMSSSALNALPRELTTAQVGGYVRTDGNHNCIQTPLCQSSSSRQWRCMAYSQTVPVPVGTEKDALTQSQRWLLTHLWSKYLSVFTQQVAVTELYSPDTEACQRRTCTDCPGPGLWRSPGRWSCEPAAEEMTKCVVHFVANVHTQAREAHW